MQVIYSQANFSRTVTSTNVNEVVGLMKQRYPELAGANASHSYDQESDTLTFKVNAGSKAAGLTVVYQQANFSRAVSTNNVTEIVNLMKQRYPELDGINASYSLDQESNTLTFKVNAGSKAKA